MILYYLTTETTKSNSSQRHATISKLEHFLVGAEILLICLD